MVAMYNYPQWIADTGVAGKPGSALPKALDRQVRQLSPTNPPLVQTTSALAAFHAWPDAKRQRGLHGVAPCLEPSAKARGNNGGFSRLLAQRHLACLMADPEEYMASYTPNEAGAGVSGVVSMNVHTDASASHAGAISDRAARKRPGITDVLIAGGVKQESNQVLNVRMIPPDEGFTSVDIESAPLPGHVEFMTTGMLSGCCFAAYRHGDVVLAARVQPREGAHGLLLKADISANGCFDVRSLDPVRTFGLGDYGTNTGNGAFTPWWSASDGRTDGRSTARILGSPTSVRWSRSCGSSDQARSRAGVRQGPHVPMRRTTQPHRVVIFHGPGCRCERPC
ncbi:MAG: hypothetical protein KGN77_00095 [Xanthomonadaceae bacterium]|nr:hypothetical protein [Xanthomonadaceae bacterium]MDE1962894.1 hypothetical protein [Xanthomonadaceae bacterium]